VHHDGEEKKGRPGLVLRHLAVEMP
jgi:hypothetical protein